MSDIFKEENRREKYVGILFYIDEDKGLSPNELHSFYRKKYGVCGEIEWNLNKRKYVFCITHLLEDNIRKLEETIESYKNDLNEVEKYENDDTFTFERYVKMQKYLKLKEELGL